MVERPQIPKKQTTAFKYNYKLDLRVHPRCSSNFSCFSAYLNRSQADRFLEDAIVDNIGITVEDIRNSAAEITGALPDSVETEPPQLTRREEQILRLILAGKTNKQIARVLSRSCRTIEYHRNRLMHKLEARNAAELVKQAIVMGIV
jgi:DNA-binding NarL/FixJ family response regulator